MLRHSTAIYQVRGTAPPRTRLSASQPPRSAGADGRVRRRIVIAMTPGLVLLLILFNSAAGCRSLSSPPSTNLTDLAAESSLSSARAAASRTIAVELSFVRHDARDPLLRAELWNFVDEQALDDGLRRRLERNGLRAGVVTGDLPQELAARLAVPDADAGLQAAERAGSRRLVHVLPGRRAEIVAAAARPEVVLLEDREDGVHGGTFRDCSGLVTLRAWPAADGRLRIEAVPELRHGAVQRTWVGEEGMFRLETGQARHRFDDLQISAVLPARGMLVIGPADADADATTVGDALLRDRAGGAAAGVQLLVIRPLAAAVDPLFADPAATAAIQQADASGW